jgi:hypothetical protein
MNDAAWKREIAKRDEIIFRQADALVAFANQVASLRQKVSELTSLLQEKSEFTSLLQEKADAKDAKKPKFAEDYSLKRQERKKLRRRKKESTGRKPTQAKQHLIQRTENVCVPSRRCAQGLRGHRRDRQLRGLRKSFRKTPEVLDASAAEEHQSHVAISGEA